VIPYTELYHPKKEELPRMKLVIVIRRDLKMGRGKEIAQGAHAAMGAYNDSMNRWGPIAGDMIEPWETNGRKKVCLKVASEGEIIRLSMLCEKDYIGHYLVRDAGRTEVQPMTPTALGIGPDYEERIDRITGDLDLY
jgi:PTH2 family peptidyl-tRNA hydrolase